MWATIIIAESFTRIMGWTAQLVMCTVLSSDRRCRFLQYNFMDPGWGPEFPTGGRPHGLRRWRRRWTDESAREY